MGGARPMSASPVSAPAESSTRAELSPRVRAVSMPAATLLRTAPTAGPTAPDGAGGLDTAEHTATAARLGSAEDTAIAQATPAGPATGRPATHTFGSCLLY